MGNSGGKFTSKASMRPLLDAKRENHGHMELRRFTNMKMALGAAEIEHLRAQIARHIWHFPGVWSSHQLDADQESMQQHWWALRRLLTPPLVGKTRATATALLRHGCMGVLERDAWVYVQPDKLALPWC
jgi:hypothetical protein